MHEARPRRRRRWLWLLPLLLLAGYGAFVGIRLFLFRPALEPGPATTAVEGHVRPDGTVDYAAALNEEWSEGVTAENNAAVPLLEAFGPAAVPPESGEAFYAELWTSPPAEGPFLVSLDDSLKQAGIDPQHRQAISEAAFSAHGPLPVGKLPEVAAWVEQNEVPLQRVVEATGRTRFFLPMVVESPAVPLYASRIDLIQRCREAARLLRVRALLRQGAGDLEGACEDALACHRLGRLVSQHPTMIGYLVGVAIDAVATEITEAIVLSGELPPDLAKSFHAGIKQLSPLADVARTIDRGERIVSLDGVLHVVKGAGASVPTGVPAPLSRGLDANVMLREVNAFYDEFVEALRIDDYTERTGRLADLQKKHFTAGSARPGMGEIAVAILTGSRTALTKHVSEVLTKLLFPAVSQAQVAEDRAAMRSDLVRVAAALAEYRAVEGEFPESVDDLLPSYLDKAPRDFYTGGAVNYRLSENGFLLYSVGPNGRDDGGKSLGECPGGRDDCDDVRFGVAPAAAIVP